MILHNIREIYPTIQITSSDILLGFFKNYFKLDILFLEIKRYIYSCKTKLISPSNNGLRNRLRLASNIYNSTRQAESDKGSWTIVRYMLQNHS